MYTRMFKYVCIYIQQQIYIYMYVYIYSSVSMDCATLTAVEPGDDRREPCQELRPSMRSPSTGWFLQPVFAARIPEKSKVRALFL